MPTKTAKAANPPIAIPAAAPGLIASLFDSCGWSCGGIDVLPGAGSEDGNCMNEASRVVVTAPPAIVTREVLVVVAVRDDTELFSPSAWST